MESRFFALANGRIQLHLGDCLAGMASLPEGSVDVIVTSPPYNLGISYGKYDDTLPRQEYLDWTSQWAVAARRVLSEEGSLFLNMGSKPTDPWVPFDVAQVFREHYVLQNTLHWIKSIALDADAIGGTGTTEPLSAGHYKPINSARFVNDCHEYVFHFTKSGRVPLERLAIGVPYQDKSNVSRWASGHADRRCRGNTWFIPYETIQSRAKDRPHPATFPTQLPEMCLKLHGTNRVRLALDPFLGLGSAALACARLGISFIGFELDPHYFQAACKRLEQAYPPVPLPEAGRGR